MDGSIALSSNYVILPDCISFLPNSAIMVPLSMQYCFSGQKDRPPLSSHIIAHNHSSVTKNLKSKKVIGMHWGTFVLSLEPIMEPPVRFKASAEKYGFKKEDTIIYKIGEFGSLKKLLNYN